MDDSLFIPLAGGAMPYYNLPPRRDIQLQGGMSVMPFPQQGARLETPNNNVVDYYGAYKNMTGSDIDASSMNGYGQSMPIPRPPPPFFGFGKQGESPEEFNARLNHAVALAETSGLTYMNNDFTSGLRRS